MKQFRIFTLLLAVMGMVFITSCVKDDEPQAMNEKDVNVSYLYGKWKNNANANWHKKYTQTVATVSNSTINNTYKDGSDWTIGETNEDQEGTEFYYKVEGNQLKEQYPTGVTGGSIYTPQTYTLMTLTSTTLEYFDNYNEVYSFTKQQ